MKTSDIVRELKAIYTDGIPYCDLDRHLTEADVQRWIVITGGSRSQLFDEIARCLAFGFNSSEFSFEFCDAVVNDLSIAVTNTTGPKPQIFWEVYSAFDEGEYYHNGNRDENPVDTYTRLMIARIVEDVSRSGDISSSGLDHQE